MKHFRKCCSMKVTNFSSSISRRVASHHSVIELVLTNSDNRNMILIFHTVNDGLFCSRHTLRFWNAAFFDAVHCERNKRSPTTREKWCHMTQEEKDDSSRIEENITFGQLGTFTHNMLAFGLSKKLCNDFLKKQAIIGNLNEEQYKLLSEHIEQMAVE